MPNRWITFVKKWASDNNFSYGCALSKPELKAAYNREYPKKIKLPKGVAKLEESKPPADVKSKMTFPNLKIRIPSQDEEQENIQFDIQEIDDEPAKAKRGRPQKYMTEEEVYKAKLESNKQKRREARAAKPDLKKAQEKMIKEIAKDTDAFTVDYTNKKVSKPYWYNEKRTNISRYGFKDVADKYKIDVDTLYDSLDWVKQTYPVKIK